MITIILENAYSNYDDTNYNDYDDDDCYYY